MTSDEDQDGSKGYVILRRTFIINIIFSIGIMYSELVDYFFYPLDDPLLRDLDLIIFFIIVFIPILGLFWYNPFRYLHWISEDRIYLREEVGRFPSAIFMWGAVPIVNVPVMVVYIVTRRSILLGCEGRDDRMNGVEEFL